MKSIITLLRVKQRELDVLKRQQATLQTQYDEVEKRIQTLIAQLQKEIQTAESMPEMAHFFSDFSIGNKKKQEQLRQHQHRIAIELEKIAAQILDRFSEMKKYEIALDQWKKQRAAKEAAIAQGEMDEIALRGFVRRDTP